MAILTNLTLLSFLFLYGGVATLATTAETYTPRLRLQWPPPLPHMMANSSTRHKTDTAPAPAALPTEGLTSKEIYEHVQLLYVKNTMHQLPNNGPCRKGSVKIRKEWGSMTVAERQNFLDSLQRMARSPSQTSEQLAPGARTRWDDFVVPHILNTFDIHFSGYFFAWHRQFILYLENVLRDECGYQGYMPYWDWPKYAELEWDENPVFDGSPYSLSGNGKFVGNRSCATVTSSGGTHIGQVAQGGGPNSSSSLCLPPGTGGGCLYNGPLVNWPVNLGPVDELNGDAGPKNPQIDGLGYNPRCIQRDFNSPQLRQSNLYANLTNLLLNYTSIHDFHPYFESPSVGVHGNGHLFMSGEGLDLYTSPADPAFFLHHAQVDRIWSIWQSLDFNNRTFALDGHQTSFNYPKSPNVTLNDQLYYSPLFANVTIRDVMSPLKGQFCHIYL